MRVNETIEQSGGKFHVENDTLALDLRLVRVHTEFLANLGGGTYFACTDLADEKGDIYDVDFFLDGEPGNMNVTRTDIHKLTRIIHAFNFESILGTSLKEYMHISRGL